MHCAEEFYQELDGDGPVIVCGVSRYSSVSSHLRYSLGGSVAGSAADRGPHLGSALSVVHHMSLGMMCSSGASTYEWSVWGAWRPK